MSVRERRAEEGWHLAPTPFGYRRRDHGSKKKEDGRLVVAKDERRIVHRAFKLRGGGQSLQAVADHMREAGYPMSKSGVRAMLTSRAYLGESAGAGKDDWHEGSHDPIVTQEEWDAANGRKAKAIRNGSIASKGILTRIVKCACCGKTMSVGASPNKRDGVYVCRSRDDKRPCSEPTTVNIPIADEFVRAAISLALADGDLQETVDVAAERARRQEAVDRARANHEHVRSNPGNRNPEDWEAMVDGSRAALDAALDRLHELPAPEDGIRPTDVTAFDFLEGEEREVPWISWEKHSIERQRATVRQLVDEVRIRRAPKRGRWGSVADRIEIKFAGHDTFTSYGANEVICVGPESPSAVPA
jgi:hypothetical protein